MSARLWLGFISTLVLLSQLQVFGNPLWQSSDDEGEKPTKDGFPCYSQADCLSDECCLVSGGDSDQQGVCKKLGTTGSKCSVVADKDQKTIQAAYCPCVKELECLASSETCEKNVGMLKRFFNIFSLNDEDENPVNGDQQQQQQQQQKKKEEEEEQEIEVREEETQEQEQEQEQEQDVEVQQQEEEQEENEETETQGEDGEDKKEEEEHSFWLFG